MIIPNLVIGEILPNDTSIFFFIQTLRYVIQFAKSGKFSDKWYWGKTTIQWTDTEIKLFDENDMKIKIKRKFVMAVLVISCCRYII